MLIGENMLLSEFKFVHYIGVGIHSLPEDLPNPGIEPWVSCIFLAMNGHNMSGLTRVFVELKRHNGLTALSFIKPAWHDWQDSISSS